MATVASATSIEIELFKRTRAVITRKCSDDVLICFIIRFEFVGAYHTCEAESFEVQLPLSLTLAELLWWVGDPDMDPHLKPVFKWPTTLDMPSGPSRWLDWNFLSMRCRDKLGLTLEQLGLKQGDVFDVKQQIIQMNYPSCYPPSTVQAREGWLQELQWTPKSNQIPLVLLLPASGQSAGAFPGEASQQRPPWALEFVRTHQDHGVVGRLILIDPDIGHGQNTDEWMMTASEGSILIYGDEYVACERFQHSELPIEAIVIRCACMAYSKPLFQPLLDFLNPGNQFEDYCTLGDGQIFANFVGRIEAAGGIVKHSPRGAVKPESLQLLEGRICWN